MQLPRDSVNLRAANMQTFLAGDSEPLQVDCYWGKSAVYGGSKKKLTRQSTCLGDWTEKKESDGRDRFPPHSI